MNLCCDTGNDNDNENMEYKLLIIECLFIRDKNKFIVAERIEIKSPNKLININKLLN